MVKAFSPADAEAARDVSIPDGVIVAVNDLLAKKYRKGAIILRIGEVQTAIVAEMKLLDKSQIVQHWLDFEEIYRKQGWKVVYDGPGYNESYEGYYEFNRK